MKKKFWCCGILFCLILVSCFTTNTSQSGGQRSNSQMKLLDPADVVGKKLVGSDETGEYSFLLNQDGLLEYTVNNIVYNGTWSFDRSTRMYRYTFDWTEGDRKQGYIVDFLANGQEITIAGHWYLTDAYITFGKEVVFEE
jgi:hypothetical protein